MTITSHCHPWLLMKRSVCLHLTTWFIKWYYHQSIIKLWNSSIGVVVLCSCLIVRSLARMKNGGSLSLREWNMQFNWIFIVTIVGNLSKKYGKPQTRKWCFHRQLPVLRTGLVLYFNILSIWGNFFFFHISIQDFFQWQP